MDSSIPVVLSTNQTTIPVDATNVNVEATEGSLHPTKTIPISGKDASGNTKNIVASSSGAVNCNLLELNGATISGTNPLPINETNTNVLGAMTKINDVIQTVGQSVPSSAQNVNLFTVAGSDVTLGQKVMDSSIPVVLSSNQHVLEIDNTNEIQIGTMIAGTEVGPLILAKDSANLAAPLNIDDNSNLKVSNQQTVNQDNTRKEIILSQYFQAAPTVGDGIWETVEAGGSFSADTGFTCGTGGGAWTLTNPQHINLCKSPVFAEWICSYAVNTCDVGMWFQHDNSNDLEILLQRDDGTGGFNLFINGNFGTINTPRTGWINQANWITTPPIANHRYRLGFDGITITLEIYNPTTHQFVLCHTESLAGLGGAYNNIAWNQGTVKFRLNEPVKIIWYCLFQYGEPKEIKDTFVYYNPEIYKRMDMFTKLENGALQSIDGNGYGRYIQVSSSTAPDSGAFYSHPLCFEREIPITVEFVVKSGTILKYDMQLGLFDTSDFAFQNAVYIGKDTTSTYIKVKSNNVDILTVRSFNTTQFVIDAQDWKTFKMEIFPSAYAKVNFYVKNKQTLNWELGYTYIDNRTNTSTIFNAWCNMIFRAAIVKNTNDTGNSFLVFGGVKIVQRLTPVTNTKIGDEVSSDIGSVVLTKDNKSKAQPLKTNYSGNLQTDQCIFSFNPVLNPAYDSDLLSVSFSGEYELRYNVPPGIILYKKTNNGFIYLVSTNSMDIQPSSLYIVEFSVKYNNTSNLDFELGLFDSNDYSTIANKCVIGWDGTMYIKIIGNSSTDIRSFNTELFKARYAVWTSYRIEMEPTPNPCIKFYVKDDTCNWILAYLYRDATFNQSTFDCNYNQFHLGAYIDSTAGAGSRSIEVGALKCRQVESNEVIAKLVALNTANRYTNLRLDHENNLNVHLQNPLSAFGHVNVCQWTPILQQTFPYNRKSRILTTSSTGNGSVTTTNSMLVLSTTAVASDQVDVISKKTISYRSGQGIVVMFTMLFSIAPLPTNSQSCAGLGTRSSGYFFGYTGGNMCCIVNRGTVGPKLTYPQSTWNLDKADGTGTLPVIDFTKGNVFKIQYQYLGFGAITFSIEEPVSGQFVPVHRVPYANSASVPSIDNPSLHFYANLDNFTDSTALSMYIGSYAAFVEGQSKLNNLLTWGKEHTDTAVTTAENCVIALQNKTLIHTGPPQYTNQNSIYPFYLTVATAGFTATATIIVYIKINPSSITGATYNDIDTNESYASFAINGTTVNNGFLVTIITLGATDSAQLDLSQFDISLEPGDIISISAKTSNGTTGEVTATLTWRE